MLEMLSHFTQSGEVVVDSVAPLPIANFRLPIGSFEE